MLGLDQARPHKRSMWMLQADAACRVVSMFLQWQDAQHRKLHIRELERDCENLRPGFGRALSPGTVELAVTNKEDLICFTLLQQQ